MHSVHSSRSPAYLADIVEPASSLLDLRDVCDLPRAVCTKYYVFVQSSAKQRFHSQARPRGTLSHADIRDETSTVTFHKGTDKIFTGRQHSLLCKAVY